MTAAAIANSAPATAAVVICRSVCIPSRTCVGAVQLCLTSMAAITREDITAALAAGRPRAATVCLRAMHTASVEVVIGDGFASSGKDHLSRLI